MSIYGQKVETFTLQITNEDIETFMIMIGKILEQSKTTGFKRDFKPYRSICEDILLTLHENYGSEE